MSSTFLFCSDNKSVYKGESRPHCDTKAKPASFCILEAYGSVSHCAKCHPGDAPFDILSYDEVKARTVPGKPEQSVLYLYLKREGKMHAFGSEHFEKAVYRWIEEGSNP
ncbi:hypothetical protein [Leptospira perolatii]|uniref:hypothetical protein n=1 Tax=Leptospira perolatii TaxID=2023191 RepID=UPI000F63B28D|nr:hypothetical protein [Leptospira perolatii]